MTPELGLIALLTLGLYLMSARIGRLTNRIRRLEQETGIDYAPPDVLDRPPECDHFRTDLLLAHRLDVLKRRFEAADVRAATLNRDLSNHWPKT